MEATLMFNAYWGMEFNPFTKDLATKYLFQSEDFKKATSRLDYLRNNRGIGLFTGLSGTGKTYCLKGFVDNLNLNLFKPIYIPISTLTVLEFYKALAFGLGLESAFKKILLFRSIQERIVILAKEKKITPVLIIDEAQYLKTELLNDLKILLNFEMDSKNYALLILSGQPVLNNILSKQIHEAVKQRIMINYNFEGITKSETSEYIASRLKLAGVHEQLFEPNAMEALFASSNSSIRKLNNLVVNCLIIAAQKKIRFINTDIVMAAQNELEII
jgi:general secretion pathway protein A